MREWVISTARGFVAPTLGTLAWVPVLLLRRRAVPFTGAGAGAELEAAGVAAWSPAPIAPLPARPAPIAPAERAAHLPRGRSAGVPIAADPRVRIALVALGSLMLVFAAAEQLRSRARYDHSDPAPGATLASPPMAVRVGFGRALDPSSHLRVDRTTPGEEATRVGVSSGLDPDDPARRTLRADLSAASAGVYRVTWRSVPAAGGGVARHGSFGFEVGRPGTEPVSGGVQERDVGERGRRSTVVGGGLLILLGALLPGLPRLR